MTNTKGIILAGGSGTRLKPMTDVCCKQLLPIYDKPMIHYPISTLLLAGIKDILIITTEKDMPAFVDLLGSGNQWGVQFYFKVQEKPRGLAEAYILAEDFLEGKASCLILGDNLFHGNLDFLRHGVRDIGLYQDFSEINQCHIFAKEVVDPERFGVVDFDQNGTVTSLVEKPKKPASNYAVPGLYLFDGSAPERAKALEPSPRGELEIIDLIKTYLPLSLNVIEMGRGMVWLDTGTPESLLDASNYIHTVQKHSGQKVADLDEIARRMLWEDKPPQVVIDQRPLITSS